jgi:AraC-like DNA-binding protein
LRSPVRPDPFEVRYGDGVSIVRVPAGPLRPFVQLVWLTDVSRDPRFGVERMLPSGAVHIAMRLVGPPVRIADKRGPDVLGHAVIGGPRSHFYLRDASAPARSVGAVLAPGAAPALLGVAASELAERHLPLDAVWPGAGALRGRLQECSSPETTLDLFESALTGKLRQAQAIDPIIPHALARLEAGDDVGQVVEAIGLSHRHFLTRFLRAVGLAPKLYSRLRRVLRVLGAHGAWAQVAADAGFSDQAHLTRELREIGGITPGELRTLWAGRGLHIPVPGASSDLFKTASPR